jgi:hypothetical protein
MTIRVVVTGSRLWQDPEPVWRKLDGLWSLFDGAVELAVGDCPTGVDSAVRVWAESHGLWRTPAVVEYVADWVRYQGYAGPERNGRMVTDHQPDLGLAFLGAPPSKNKGTRNCIYHLEEFGALVHRYFEGELCKIQS